MNTDPKILNLATATDPVAEPENAADALLRFERRGNGKIARLSKEIRDQVNQMILDGTTYPEIIQRLGDQGKDLAPGHLCEWKKRGYRDWLLQQEWLDRMTSKSSFSADILSAPETSTLHEAGLRFAAAQMFDQLMRFNAVLDAPESPDVSDKFSRLVNALSRLNRAALSFKKYADLRADAKAQEAKQLDPNHDFSTNESAALAQLWQRFFLGPNYKPIPPGYEQQAAQSPAPAPATCNPQPSATQ